MRKLLCLIIVCVMLSSCSGTHCMKASYMGAEIEYCWNNSKSEKLQRPVIDSEGKEYIGLTTDELGGLWALLGDKKKEEVGIKTIPPMPEKEPVKIEPLAGLLKLLEK